ncbi:MAG: tetratricopeptide repeat protein [bacterium]|nr:tetratricopeptide repeat protein [bacterium]
MIARVLCALVIAGIAVPASAALTLADGWVLIQQSLTESDAEGLQERIGDLQIGATEVGARRLTPYAMALVRWAENHPDEIGRIAIQGAIALDPLLPSPHFLLAQFEWRSGSKIRAAQAYFLGWIRMFAFESSRRVLLGSAVVWLLCSLAIACSAAIILQTARHLRVLLHDARELGRILFKAVNAVVFTIVVLTLPIFGGLGPIWVVVYLFALTWVYYSKLHRSAAIVICIVMMLFVPALEAWQHFAMREGVLVNRLEQMLATRSLDLVTLREFSELEPTLDGSAEYHMILAEAFRLHGETEASRLQFQKTALTDQEDPRPQIALGNMALEDGDLPRALDHYRAAIEIDPQSILAYFNLSFAYDQSYNFQEADGARSRARELGGARAEDLGVRGRAPRIRFPGVDRVNIDRMLEGIPPATRLAAGLGSVKVRPWQWFVSPLPLIFLFGIVFGLIVLLVRSKWMWKATACMRCGKVFCARCQTSSESGGYCGQCVSVFLKRDLVSIEQQSAKMSQIKRWDLMRSSIDRIVSILLPGGSLVLRGQMLQGLFVGLAAWLCLLGTILWLPVFASRSVENVQVLPIQIVMAIGCLVFWMRSVAVGWSRR